MPLCCEISPMIGVSTAPPMIAITRIDAPILVFSPTFNTKSEDGRIHDGHEEAGEEDSPQSHPTGRKDANEQKSNVDDAVDPHQLGCTDFAHDRRGGEAAYAKRKERSGKKISGHFLRAVRVVLHILDEVAPCAHLRSNVHELREQSGEEVRVAQQVAEFALPGIANDALGGHCWKTTAPDEKRHEEGESAQHEIWVDDTQRLIAKIAA